jgi:hypothetical protein
MMSAPTAARTDRRNPDYISVARTMVELFIIGATAILFNFYPRTIGFWRSAADPTSFTSLLGPGFAPFLPWLNTYWFWAFWLCVANLALQRWTLVTRLLDLALNLFAAAIFAAMFSDSPFLEIPVATLAAKSVLLVVCFGFLLGALDQFVHLLRWQPRAGEAGDAGVS